MNLNCLSGRRWSYPVGATILMVAIILGTATLQSYVAGDWSVVSIVAYSFACIIGSAAGLGFAFPKLAGGLDWLESENRLEWEEGLIILVILPVGLVPLAFGGLCQELYVHFGGFSGVPTPAFSNDDWAWATFGYSWLLDGLTSNASQVFGWLTTPIRPTAWWSSALIVLFNVVIDVVLFAMLVTYFWTYWKAREISWRTRG